VTAKQARYERSTKGKATSARYRRSAKGKAAIARYRRSAKGKAASTRYKRDSPAAPANAPEQLRHGAALAAWSGRPQESSIRIKVCNFDQTLWEQPGDYTSGGRMTGRRRPLTLARPPTKGARP
jgi:hypothetical protein